MNSPTLCKKFALLAVLDTSKRFSAAKCSAFVLGIKAGSEESVLTVAQARSLIHIQSHLCDKCTMLE